MNGKKGGWMDGWMRDKESNGIDISYKAGARSKCNEIWRLRRREKK